MSFKIVVDSCCELTPAMLKDPVFVKVPLTIQSNGSTFVDDETFDQADLLWSMRQSEDAPTALLSGSHNSAEQARLLLEEERPEVNVHVFNSCSAASGELLVAMAIHRLASAGMPFKRVVTEVEQFIYQMQTLFVLESLENLRKNCSWRQLRKGRSVSLVKRLRSSRR